jgi:hypothetical protein
MCWTNTKNSELSNYVGSGLRGGRSPCSVPVRAVIAAASPSFEPGSRLLMALGFDVSRQNHAVEQHFVQDRVP